VSEQRALRLIEECVGVGQVAGHERVVEGVAYAVRRFQGFAPSGLPVPGLHRLEGRLEIADDRDRRELVNRPVTLRMADGRTMRLTLLDEDGRVLAEGHGPSRCQCC
jgi:hypothetical protein